MKVHVNGEEFTVNIEGNPSLLEVLREQLELTGSKYGCGEGVCGACKVIVNGAAVPSCITPVNTVRDKQVITIEGLAKNGKLNRVQQAMLEEDVFQCGFCAPGMIISATALMEKYPNPTPELIMDHMQGNICRCCTYTEVSQALRKIS